MLVKQTHMRGLALASTLSLCIFFGACNDDSSGNQSTEPSESQMDTVNNGGTNSLNSDINNSDSTPSAVPSSGSTGAGASATDTTGGRRAAIAKRKGRITTTIAKDDATAKMAMDAQGYYNRTEVAPGYSGGQTALENYIINNIEYPTQAIDNNVEGTVNVQFAVDDKGNISNVKTVGSKVGYGLEEEAIRVVSRMPKWTPGKVKGKNVKTWRTLPISYQLEG